MENTTLDGNAPITRRQAREIERRTGVRPLVGAVQHDTGEIERNEMNALVSVFPTELVERISAPIAAADQVEVPETFAGRSLSVRAARPASLVAARRRRAVGGFAAAASLTAFAAAGITTLGSDGATVAADAHQANLLSATDANEALELPEEADETAAEVAVAPEVQVDAESTTVERIDVSTVQAAATEVVEETPAETSSETSGGSNETGNGSGKGGNGGSSEAGNGGSQAASSEAPSGVGATTYETALGLVGTGTYGNGNTPAGWDCSGFVQYVYAQHGISIPRSVNGQAAMGTQVSNPQPGDLVIWPGQHVGIYAGNGMMIDSPNWGRSIELDAVAYGPSPSGYYFVRI